MFANPSHNRRRFVNHGRDIAATYNGEQLLISTLEGQMRADVGDWVIRGVKGEFYPCKPDIFAATYEPVARAAAGEGKP